MKILVIDDDPVIRSLVGDMLRGLGHDVSTAESGSEGLRMLASEIPQVIFLDYQLPDMNGLEVLKKVRAQQNTCSLPVVVLSASDESAFQKEAGQAGASRCMEKPFKLDDFVRVLASLST